EQSVDVNAVVARLLQLRDPEWRTPGLRGQNRLSPEPALVVGAHGQMEQVFLNLLIHAEQYAAEAPGKTLAIASSVIARRALVEICYSTQAPDGEVHDPFAEGATPRKATHSISACARASSKATAETFDSAHGPAWRCSRSSYPWRGT